MTPIFPVWAIKLCSGLVLLAAIVVPSCRYGYGKGKAAGDAEVAQMKADFADAALYAERTARETEQAHAQALADVAQQYEQDKSDAQDNHDRIVAGLRAGTVKLQDHWACPASGVPSAGPSPGLADAGADLREQGAADLIAAADECDAQVRGLQAVTQQDRASQ